MEKLCERLFTYMRLTPQSARETIYTGVAAFLPVIGQLVILTRPKLSTGAKVRGSIYGLFGSFFLLMLIPAPEVDQSVIASEEAGVEGNIEVARKLFEPRESCGDVGANADLVYPVYLDNIDLELAQSNFCGDAFLSINEETGDRAIVVASFDALDKALEFSDEIDGRVGEPDFSRVREEKVIAEATSPVIQDQPSVVEQPAPQPKTDEQKFADTLVSATPGFLAQEQMGLLAPGWYENRENLWVAIEGLPINQSEAITGQMLKKVSYENGLGWDDKLIDNMSKGLVKGLYAWNN